MSWIFYALMAPAIWAAVNHIDKYIISRYFHDSPASLLVVFTSLTAFLAAIGIAIFVPIVGISIHQILFIVFGGMIFVAAYIPYVYALKEDEASLVAPLFQMIFVFSFILGFLFLGEKLTMAQFIASICILIGSIILSIDLDSSVRKLRSKTFYRMALASFLIALNMLIFKIVALGSSFWVTTFWEYIGAALFGILLLILSRKIHKAFFDTLKRTKVIIGWNIFNEFLNLLARLSANFASLVAPLALISLVNGAQPFFIVLYGAIIPFIFNGTEKEKFYGKYLNQKIVSIVLMIIGAYFLFR
jgi:drug/metabolite transporter (DMT)-like permease